MTRETNQPSGLELVEKQIRASYVTTSLTAERMLTAVNSSPDRRKEIFGKYLKQFRADKMADPWIYEPAILDNYGTFDEFAYEVYSKHNFFGVQNIVTHMENPTVVGGILTHPEMGTMLHWPGFDEYSWVKDCKDWHNFMARCIEIDETGKQVLVKNNAVTSRLWLGLAMCWADYYNPAINPQFDQLFSEWRTASVKLIATLYDRNEQITPDRLCKRSYYLDMILPEMVNEQKRADVQAIINSQPDIIKDRVS